jgi:cholesterol transport system auxiliary component
MLAVALAVAIPGCSLKPVDVERRTAVLDALPPAVPGTTPIAATLLVLATDAAPPYDTTQMAYATVPHEVAYFARHEWADPPARMINGLTVRALEGTRRFRAVVSPPHVGRVEYTLATELVELRQDFTAEPPSARVAVRAELRDEKGRSLAAKRFEASAPLAARGPEAGVAAANAAVARMLGDLARFVIEAAR